MRALVLVILVTAAWQAGCAKPSQWWEAATPGTAYRHAPGADFASRCQAAGVLRCFGFDTDADFVGNSAGSSGYPNAWGLNYGFMPNSATVAPVRDTTQKASGTSSLKFTIPSQSGADHGSWFTNFMPDLSNELDEGGEVWIQWRQRFSPEVIATAYAPGDGMKLIVISAGDVPGMCNQPGQHSGICPTSCWDFEVVLQEHASNTKIPSPYASCGGPFGYNHMYGFTSNITIQNATGCLYPRYPTPPCVKMVADQWMTFKVHIKVGTWNSWTSIIQMWMAQEGQPPVLITDCGPQGTAAGHPCNAPTGNNGWYLFNYLCTDAQFAAGKCGTRLLNHRYKIGKIYLLPYQTNRVLHKSIQKAMFGMMI